MLTILLTLLGVFPPSVFIVGDLIRPPLILISAFLSSCLILFSMEIEFVSFAFLMLYVGVTAIIFLFEVLTINVEYIEKTSPGGLKFFIVVCSCTGLFFYEWSFFFYIKEFFFLYLDMYNSFDSIIDFYHSSYLLYCFHSFTFLIAGLTLLIILLLTMDFTIILVFLLVELITLFRFVCLCLKSTIFSFVKKYILKK